MNPGKQRGANLLELAFASLIIAILASVLLNRLLRYQELAEKTVMETTVANMRSGLRWRMAELIMHDRESEFGKLSQENPIGWLQAPPAGYLGQLDHPEERNIPPGSWYFDKNTRELVYVPDRSRYLKPDPDGGKAIRFRVTAVTKKQDENLNLPPQVESVNITLVRPYVWPVF